MIFRIELPKKIDPSLYKSVIYHKAKHYILRHYLTTDDKILEKYLLKNYNIKLKSLCLLLIRTASYTTDLSNTIIVRFKNEIDNKLATLITYGNGEILGSNILREALR